MTKLYDVLTDEQADEVKSGKIRLSVIAAPYPNAGMVQARCADVVTFGRTARMAIEKLEAKS